MDTLGSLIDKLTTINLKMWNVQDELYKIRRMTFEEYKKTYFDDPNGPKILWDALQRACDLNVQRNNLIDEIDNYFVKVADKIRNGEDLSSLVQLKHKTY